MKSLQELSIACLAVDDIRLDEYLSELCLPLHVVQCYLNNLNHVTLRLMEQALVARNKRITKSWWWENSCQAAWKAQGTKKGFAYGAHDIETGDFRLLFWESYLRECLVNKNVIVAFSEIIDLVQGIGISRLTLNASDLFTSKNELRSTYLQNVELLKRLPSTLSTLCLHHFDNYEMLSSLIKYCSSITRIRFVHCKVTKTPNWLITYYSIKRKVQLEFHHCRITNVESVLLQEELLSSLSGLSLIESHSDGNTVLQKCHQTLRKLAISGTTTDYVFTNVQSSVITDLELSHNHLLSSFPALKFKNLQRLNLSHTSIGDNSLYNLKNHCCNLKALNISECENLSSNSITDLLSSNELCQTIEELDISGNYIGAHLPRNSFEKVLAQFIIRTTSTLSSLKCDYIGLSSQSSLALSTALGATSKLQHLSLEGNKLLGSVALEFVNALVTSSHSDMSVLNLSRNQISSTDCGNICKIIYDCCIEREKFDEGRKRGRNVILFRLKLLKMTENPLLLTQVDKSRLSLLRTKIRVYK